MGKIKEAQDALSKPRLKVDKPAAERFIKRNIPKSALWENSKKKAATTASSSSDTPTKEIDSTETSKIVFCIIFC